MVVANYRSIDGRPILDLFPSFRLLFFFLREHSPRLASLQEETERNVRIFASPRPLTKTRVSCPRLNWASCFCVRAWVKYVLCAACNPIVTKLAQIVACLGRPLHALVIITRRSFLFVSLFHYRIEAVVVPSPVATRPLIMQSVLFRFPFNANNDESVLCLSARFSSIPGGVFFVW